MLKSRNLILFFLLVVLVGTAGCGSPATSEPTTVLASMATHATAIPSPTFVPVTDSCYYEEQMVGQQYQFRSSDGCGFNVISSLKQWPNSVEKLVTIEKASAEWHDLQRWETWVELYGTIEEAREAVCKAVKEDGRTIEPSKWTDKDFVCPP